MGDIFISYCHEDRPIARRFADALGREGLSVWWDEAINAGESFDTVTEQALKDATAVVVLWSKSSVESRWVRSEATLADRAGKLVPVTIEPCARPMQFELTHTLDLSSWNGNSADPRWRALIDGLRRLLDKGGAAPGSAAPASPAGQAAAARPRARSRIALLAAAALLIGAGAWWIGIHRGSAPVIDTAVPAAPSAEVSLAVLPFADLSQARDQEYFSDGLTEEILDQLAQIPALRLVGRTSSFSFKGKNEDLRMIGEKLGVANLLEGSVRKDGDQLRITAQLIRARDGTHVWSRTYAREVRAVFAVQEEIARDVAQALSITLDIGALSRSQGGTTNLEAHDRWLRLQKLVLSDDYRPEVIRRRVQLAREAAALDPQFVLAWDELANALRYLAAQADGAQATRLRAEAAQAIDHVAALAPDSWIARRRRVDDLMRDAKWAQAEAVANEIVKAEPWAARDFNRAYPLINVLFAMGHLDATIALVSQVQARDPLAMFISRDQQYNFFAAGRFEESEAEYQRSRALEGSHADPNFLAWVRLLSRRDADPRAVRALYRIVVEEHPDVPFLRDLGTALDDRPRMAAILRKAHEGGASGEIPFVLAAALGDRDLAFALLHREVVEGKAPYRFFALWLAPYPELRSDPRFAQILREVGLADYWRQSGNWADFCQPVGEDGFECH